MNKYLRLKSAAREKAIEWQSEQSERAISYGELAVYRERFEKLAKRYGLTKEFRENGII